MKKLTFALPLLAVMLTCAVTSAAPVLYTTSASFNTAAGVPLSTENFNGGPTGSVPIVVGGISITQTGSQFASVFPAIFGSGNSLTYSTNNPGSVTLTFGSPITAFGADFYDVGTVGATTMVATLSNGDVLDLFTLFTSGFGNLAFRGVISTTPFTSITISNTAGGDFVEIDNLQFGLAAPVPEPASMLAWGLIVGVGGLGYRLRKRKAQVVA